MGLGLVQRALSEVGFAPSAASVEHVNGPTLPVISRSYVDTEFHGSLNSPVVNFADSNESLAKYLCITPWLPLHFFVGTRLMVITADTTR